MEPRAVRLQCPDRSAMMTPDCDKAPDCRKAVLGNRGVRHPAREERFYDD